MALTTLGNTAFGTSSVVSASIKDSAVVYNKLDANTAHTDRNQSFTVAQRGSISALGVYHGLAGNTVTLDLNTSNYYSLRQMLISHMPILPMLRQDRLEHSLLQQMVVSLVRGDRIGDLQAVLHQHFPPRLVKSTV